jgi:hypothetical protein
MSKKLLLTFLLSIILITVEDLIAETPVVEINVNAPSDTNFELDFRSTEKVTHFEFFFIPPEGCRIIDVQNTPGEVKYTEVWNEIDGKYALKYKIDIFNYNGIESADYRKLADIFYEKYKLKSIKRFSFENIKTRNNERIFGQNEVIFYNSPYPINFGSGMPMEKINYTLSIDKNSFRKVENVDSCFIVLDCYLEMKNTKEMISNLTFDFIVPTGGELVRTEPLRTNGIFDPYKIANFKKSSKNGYTVSLTPGQPEWPIEPFSVTDNGKPIMKLSLHIYDFCINTNNIIELQNIISMNEMNQENNETNFDNIELSLEDFYYNNFLKGDISGYCFGDKQINSADISELKKYLDESIAFNCYQKWAADMDDNGIIDKNDLAELSGFSSVEKCDLTFNIYPNPASNILNIEAEKMINSIEIYDIKGKYLNSYQTNSIDVSDYTAGTYIIKINYTDSFHTQKFQIK